MKQRIKQRTLCLALLAIGFIATLSLTGCSTDDATDNRLPPGKYPMTFTTTVEGLAQTRATVDNTWMGTEEVAVMVGNTVKKYNAASDGGLTPANSSNKLYWTNKTMTVQAWHSAAYSGIQPTYFTVQRNQNSGATYQQSDVLYTSQSITFNASTSPELTFKHLPVKVIVNLNNGDGVTQTEVQNATVSIVNQSLTSGTIAEDGTVAQTAGIADITPKKSVTPATGYEQTVQALLVPQQMQGKKFIKVTIGSGTDERTYYYTPTKDTDADLKAGNQYTYDITVKKTGLAVTLSEGPQWGNGGSQDVNGVGQPTATLISNDHYRACSHFNQSPKILVI